MRHRTASIEKENMNGGDDDYQGFKLKQPDHVNAITNHSSFYKEIFAQPFQALFHSLSVTVIVSSRSFVVYCFS